MYVFAYGSLVDARSRRATLGDAAVANVTVIPAYVRSTWGHRRAYNVAADNGVDVYLGLEPTHSATVGGEGGGGGGRGSRRRIHGVLLAVTPAQFATLRRRERYYRVVRIPRSVLVSFPPLPDDGRPVVTFYPLRRHVIAPSQPTRRYRALVERGFAAYDLPVPALPAPGARRMNHGR